MSSSQLHVIFYSGDEIARIGYGNAGAVRGEQGATLAKFRE